MKIVNLLFLLLPFFSFKNVSTQNADAIIGNWLSEDKNLKVEIFKCGNEYKGRVVWFDDTDDKTRPMVERLDKSNPDKTMRNKKILGSEVMHGLIYNKDDEEWQGGRIYDCTTGKDWNAKAWLNKEGILKVRGYWHVSFFGQNMSFKKV